MEGPNKKATVMIMSGDMDKALVAFLIATGYAAMGIETKMWFTLWGVNCLKRRRSIFHVLFGKFKLGKSQYRRTETDSVAQSMLEMLNRGGANHMPISQLNLFGLGPSILNFLLRRKNIPTLNELINLAEELGISFTICQICVNALALDTSDLIVTQQVEVKGVSQYVKDSMDSHYNTVI